MGKIIIHNLNNEMLLEKRKHDFFLLNTIERFKKTLDLIRVSRLINLNNEQKTKGINIK